MTRITRTPSRRSSPARATTNLPSGPPQPGSPFLSPANHSPAHVSSIQPGHPVHHNLARLHFNPARQTVHHNLARLHFNPARQTVYHSLARLQSSTRPAKRSTTTRPAFTSTRPAEHGPLQPGPPSINSRPAEHGPPQPGPPSISITQSFQHRSRQPVQLRFLALVNSCPKPFTILFS